MIRPAGVLCLLLAAPRLAWADTPITDRSYVIDAYRGAAVADYRVIGMGGVSLATAEGALGLLANPAAAASRPSTASGWFYWDFLLDAYTPGLGVDYDNNGTPQDRFNGTTGALNAGLGPTPWNRRVTDEFRDERNTILAADLIVSGPVADGAGLEAFLQKQLQPSGRHGSVSLRLGAEYEWIPGWLRIRGGSYWEPPRFADVTGRLHLTLGLDVRFWSFSLWGSQYRMRISLGADGARQYGNSVLSLGFWH